MAQFRRITDDIWAGQQIFPADLEKLKSAGFKSIINNRPDGEAPMQPTGDDLEKAAKKAGFDYAFIPMHGLSIDSILASEDAFNELPKPILCFCTSGTRSAMLWCFAAVKDLGIESVLERSLKAGYDLQHLRPALQNYMDNYG